MGGGAEGTEADRHIHLILIAGDPVYINTIYVNFVNIKETVRIIVRKIGTLKVVMRIGNTNTTSLSVHNPYLFAYILVFPQLYWKECLVCLLFTIIFCYGIAS